MNGQLERTERQAPATAGEGSERTRSRQVFLPPTDIYETKDRIVVLAEMPGVQPDAVDITLERRVLTIRGQARKDEHPGYRKVYAEYAEGDYERVFTLNEDIDQDGIEALHENGVLKLILPKAEQAKARRIQVRSG